MTTISARLQVRHYKNFGDELVGYDEIKPINVVVGRNNVGKSSLIDLVECACTGAAIGGYAQRDGTPSEVLLTTECPEDIVRAHFREGNRGGELHGEHWRDFGSHLRNVPL